MPGASATPPPCHLLSSIHLVSVSADATGCLPVGVGFELVRFINCRTRLRLRRIIASLQAAAGFYGI